jgi:hypothetical protein
MIKVKKQPTIKKPSKRKELYFKNIINKNVINNLDNKTIDKLYNILKKVKLNNDTKASLMGYKKTKKR